MREELQWIENRVYSLDFKICVKIVCECLKLKTN